MSGDDDGGVPDASGSEAGRALDTLLGLSIGAILGALASFAFFAPLDAAAVAKLRSAFLPWMQSFLSPEPAERDTFAVVAASAAACGLLAGRIGRRRLSEPRSLAVAVVAALGVVASVELFLTQPTPWRAGSVYLSTSFAVVAVLLGACRAFRVRRGSTPPAIPADRRAPSSSAPPRPPWSWHDAAALSLCAVLVCVWDARGEAERILVIDRFQHWNSFAIAPGLYAQAGDHPGRDFVPQYGIGVPAVWAGLGRLGIEGSVASLLPLAGCAFAVYYLLLWRALLRVVPDRRLALLALVAAMTFELLCMDQWHGALAYPASTPLRRPLDVVLLRCVLGFAGASTSRSFLAWVGMAAATVGAGIFWVTDTGIAMALALAAALIAGAPPGMTRRGLIGTGFTAAAACLAAFAALTAVFYGPSALSREFVAGLTLPITRYRTEGLWAVPQWADFAADPWRLVLFNLVTPAAYVLATALPLARRRPERSVADVASVYLGVLGLGIYQLYLHRSVPGNWYHSSGPLLVLGAILVSRRRALPRELGLAGRSAALAARGAPAIAAGMVLYLFLAGRGPAGVVDYPNGVGLAWRRIAHAERPAPVTLDAERRVASVLRGLTIPGERILCLGHLDAEVIHLAGCAPAGRVIPPLKLVVTREDVGVIAAEVRRVSPRYVVYDDSTFWPPAQLYDDVTRPVMRLLEASYKAVRVVGPYVILERR